MLRQHKSTIIALLVLLLVTTAFVSVAAANPDTPDDESFDVTDNSSVWAGSPFVLQASSENTVSELDESDQLITFDGQGSAFPLESNTGTIKTYETGASIDFDYEKNGNFDPTEWGDISEDGQIHLIELEEDEDISGVNVPGSVADLEDLLNKEDVNNNATFTDITADNAGSGNFSFTLGDEFDDPGMYAVLVTLNESGNGIIVDENTNKIDDLDGDVTVMGMEGVAIEDGGATINSPSEAEPGDSLEFDVNSDLDGDIHHAVAVYDISQIENEELTIDIGDTDLNDVRTDDLTVKSNIESVRGEANIEDEIIAGDRTLVSDSFNRQGEFTIQDIFSRIANESDDVDAPDHVGDGEILDASMTAVVTDESDGTITVETDGDWAETEYRVVYLASTNTSSDQFRTATDALTIEDDTSTGGGGGGGARPAPPVIPGDDVIEVPEEIQEELGDDAVVTDEDIVDIVTDETGASSATFRETSNVESITFRQAVQGQVTVRNIDGIPAATGSPPGQSATTSQIVVPEEVRNSEATLRMRISAERLNNLDVDAEELVAHRHADGEWNALETEVVSQTDQRVVVQAETPGFSYFAVSTAEEDEDLADDDEPVEDPDDGVGTTGLIGLIVVLALVVAAAVAYRQMNSGGDNNL